MSDPNEKAESTGAARRDSSEPPPSARGEVPDLHNHPLFTPFPKRVTHPVIALALLTTLIVLVYSLRTAGAALGGVADQILFASFVVFAMGLAQLFLLFVALAILGRINLPRVFQDKHDLPDASDNSKEALYVRAVAGRGSVSLSRLQAFLWTLVVLTTYFHKAVTDQSDELPSIPPDLLLVMGISGAVYLTSKQIAKK